MKPLDTTGINFTNSLWQNSETETVARNVCFVQRAMNENKWSPFTFEQYEQHCTHKVTDSERHVLEAMVNGGKPHFSSRTYLQPGYLEKRGDSYVVTEKFINVLQDLIK